MEHRFGQRPGFPLGIEEELLLVDPSTFDLVNIASKLAALEPVTGAVTTDLFESLIECSTPVVRNAPEGVEALAALREQLYAAGATLLGGGVHPEARFGDVTLVSGSRYAEISDQLHGLVTRTPTAGLHVHVGMPDPETAIAVCNRMRAHLPLLQALATHSPFWHGLDSGLASARALLFRTYPRSTIPRAFADWEDYVHYVNWWLAAGELPDYTFLWWDIRPSPRLGTVEVRSMDAQTRLESVGGLAALVHALAVACADGAEELLPHTEALNEASFRAARDGVNASIWWRGTMRPMREVGADALSLARPYARELDGEDALEEIERILREGSGADRMREARAAGGPDELLARLASETQGPVQEYRYPSRSTSVAPRATREAHVAEPRIAVAGDPRHPRLHGVSGTDHS